MTAELVRKKQKIHELRNKENHTNVHEEPYDKFCHFLNAVLKHIQVIYK